MVFSDDCTPQLDFGSGKSRSLEDLKYSIDYYKAILIGYETELISWIVTVVFQTLPMKCKIYSLSP